MCLKSWRPSKDVDFLKCFLLFSLKLTACTWKWMCRIITRCLLGQKACFQGRAFAVSFREGIPCCLPLGVFLNKYASVCFEPRLFRSGRRCLQMSPVMELLWVLVRKMQNGNWPCIFCENSRVFATKKLGGKPKTGGRFLCGKIWVF